MPITKDEILELKRQGKSREEVIKYAKGKRAREKSEAEKYAAIQEPGLERPGIGGTLLDPSEILLNVLTGGVLGAAKYIPGGVARGAYEVGTYGIPSLTRVIRRGGQALLEGLRAPAIEKMRPVEKAVPITPEVVRKLLPATVALKPTRVFEAPVAPEKEFQVDLVRKMAALARKYGNVKSAEKYEDILEQHERTSGVETVIKPLFPITDPYTIGPFRLTPQQIEIERVYFPRVISEWKAQAQQLIGKGKPTWWEKGWRKGDVEKAFESASQPRVEKEIAYLNTLGKLTPLQKTKKASLEKSLEEIRRVQPIWNKIKTKAIRSSVSRFKEANKPIPGNLLPDEIFIPLSPETVRLYRAETGIIEGEKKGLPGWLEGTEEIKGIREATGRWFSDSLENAKYYQKKFGEGKPITYVDVPKSELEKYRASNLPEGKYAAPGRAKEEFFLPKEVASQRKPLTSSSPHKFVPKSQMDEVERILAPGIVPEKPTTLQTFPALGGIKETIRGVWDRGNFWHSPHIPLRRTPQGARIFDLVDDSERAKLAFYKSYFSDYDEIVKKTEIIEESDNSILLGKLLDREQTPETLRGLPANMRQAYEMTRKIYRNAADLAGLNPKDRFKNYLPHVFDRKEVQEAIQREIKELKKMKILSPTDKARLDLLEKSQEQIGKGIIFSIDQLPKEIKFPFFLKRKGVPGYSFDSMKSLKYYIFKLGQKLYDEPVVTEASKLLSGMPDHDREYAKWFLRQYLGLDRRSTALENTIKTIRDAEFVRTIGFFNPRSAIVNWGQKLNTVVEIGPVNTARGYAMMHSDWGKSLFDKSGLSLEIPFVQTGRIVLGTGDSLDKLIDVTGVIFKKVEKGNRGTTYLGSLHAWFTRQGLTSEEAIKRMRNGTIPREAYNYAVEIVRKTQFQYGKIGLPKIVRGPLGSILGQFQTFSLKQLELMQQWTKEGSEGMKKLLVYLAASQGILEGGKALDIDLSRDIGIGIDYAESLRFLFEATTEDWSKARQRLRKAFPLLHGEFGVLPFGGRLGPGWQGAVGLYETIKEAGRSIETGEPGKMLKAAGRTLERHIEPVQEKRTRQAIAEYMNKGASFPEALSSLVGFPIAATVTRNNVLRYLEQGQETKAETLMQKYAVDNGEYLHIEPDAITEARMKWKKETAERREKGRVTPPLEKIFRERPWLAPYYE